MGIVRRLSALDAVVGILALLFPPLRYVPRGAALAAALVVGAIWTINRHWVGPLVISTDEQRASANGLRRQAVNARLSALVDAEGSLFEPPDRWVDPVLENPEWWGTAIAALRRARIYKPSNALSVEKRSLVWQFLNVHLDDPAARRLALLVFRVGGPPPQIFVRADRFRADEEATWFFDGLETMGLLADERFAWSHERRRIRPWLEEPLTLAVLSTGPAAAVGLFYGKAGGWALRAGGPGLDAEACELDRYGALRDSSNHVKQEARARLGAAHYRIRDVRRVRGRAELKPHPEAQL